MPYYHGSFDAAERGTRWEGRGEAYAQAWAHTDFYAVLERYRPASMRQHANSVFMVADVDDIDLAGGATEFCLEVQPEGLVARHDLNWSTEISMLISDGKSPDDPEVMKAALAYWAGEPHVNESVWEFTADAFIVLRCEPYETFDASRVAPPWNAPEDRGRRRRARR